MKNLDEGMFYLFGIGTLYILVTIFRGVDIQLQKISEKISYIDLTEQVEMCDKSSQTEEELMLEIVEKVPDEKIPETRKKILGYW